jgi:hypothetical protein
MVYTARISEYMYNSATVKGPEAEGQRVEQPQTKAKVVTPKPKLSVEKVEVADTK